MLLMLLLLLLLLLLVLLLLVGPRRRDNGRGSDSRSRKGKRRSGMQSRRGCGANPLIIRTRFIASLLLTPTPLFTPLFTALLLRLLLRQGLGKRQRQGLAIARCGRSDLFMLARR